jgi:hypothetical protein
LTHGGYETILFGIKAFFDLHPNWVMMQVNVENVFNIIYFYLFFRKLQDAGGFSANIIPSTKLFYDAYFFLYFQHGQHEKGVTIIESFSNIRQGDEKVLYLP